MIHEPTTLIVANPGRVKTKLKLDHNERTELIDLGEAASNLYLMATDDKFHNPGKMVKYYNRLKESEPPLTIATDEWECTALYYRLQR